MFDGDLDVLHIRSEAFPSLMHSS